jgi:hypothetical protein
MQPPVVHAACTHVIEFDLCRLDVCGYALPLGIALLGSTCLEVEISAPHQCCSVEFHIYFLTSTVDVKGGESMCCSSFHVHLNLPRS